MRQRHRRGVDAWPPASLGSADPAAMYAEAVLTRVLITCAVLAGCSGQSAPAETVPRPSVDQYPVRASGPGLRLGAEYFGRSAPGGRDGFFTGHFIVVEVAIYPDKGQTVTVRPSDFRLVINGERAGLMAQTGSLVAGELKYYDVDGPIIAVGAGPLVIGRPRAPNSIPENPGGTQPPRPQAPDQNPLPADQRTVPDDPAKALPMLELGQVATREPRSGYLYFYWKPHTKKIRTMELRWEPDLGAPPAAVLRLLPQR